jgi:glyoxylase-like metal-dependent hydrolase (beta-lactamase superfamily II)
MPAADLSIVTRLTVIRPLGVSNLREVNKMHFRPMLLVEETNDKSMMTYLTDVGTPISIGVYSWLIEGASQNVLVDAGCPADFLNSIGFPAKQISTQEAELEKAGLTVDDIDLVILTHLHVDHAKDVDKFKNATLVVQKSELEFAANPHPIQAGWFVLPPQDRLHIVDGDAEILDGIRVLHTPGHTPGCQSVLIETDQGSVCLCGQCTILDNVDPPQALKDMGVPAITPGIHTNAMQAYDSLTRIQEAADHVVALHDMSYRSAEHIP